MCSIDKRFLQNNSFPFLLTTTSLGLIGLLNPWV
jgi:hypothetical protein